MAIRRAFSVESLIVVLNLLFTRDIDDQSLSGSLYELAAIAKLLQLPAEGVAEARFFVDSQFVLLPEVDGLGIRILQNGGQPLLG